MENTKCIKLTAYEKKRLLEVKAYVDSQLEKKLTAEEAALLWGLSLYKLKAGFMLFFQTSFSCYVRTCRMHKAKELLLTTNKIIYEIARDCGYKDVSAFVRAFRKQVGQTPDAFRKN